MAKKESAPSTKKQTASAPKPPRQRFLSNDQIGEVAGEVWALLNEDRGQSLAAIKKSIDAPADVVMAAVGWLAREEKLRFQRSGRTVKLSLR